MSFFLIFHKHPILSCRYFVKKRQFCQNQNTWWAIKVHKMPFFSNSSWNNRCSHTHILSQVRLFSKEHTALKFMFYEKMSVLSKTLCSCHFFKFFMKNPLLSSPYMVKKTSNLSKLHYFGPEKTIGCPSFLIFHGKIIALISTAHIFSKNRPFSKNHLFLCPYYVKKTSILTKTNCSHIIFIKIFIKNSLRSYLYLVKKTSILSKLHIMTKKVNRMSFFSDISRKKCALMPI